MWFNGFPEESYKIHLLQSLKLVSTAVASGYRNARLISDLAFLTAILEGPPQGKILLNDIRNNGAALDWNEIAKLASQADSLDLASEGFVLGMDQSAVWTRLGTFARMFMGDDQLAEALYRTAIQMNPHDAVALTNLARQLISKDDDPALAEAKKLLSRAQNCADRRFFWWRHVLASISKEDRPAQKQTDQRTLAHPHKITSIQQIRAAFKAVGALPNRQQRGLELERLVFDLSAITYGVAAPPYVIKRERSGVIRQIDGFFYHGLTPYRVECKWLDEPLVKMK
jgi:tetratricopeptide (TPR) repeat protein